MILLKVKEWAVLVQQVNKKSNILLLFNFQKCIIYGNNGDDMNAIYEEMNTYERMTQEELEKIYAFEGVASYDLAQYIKDIKKRLLEYKEAHFK